MNDPIEDALIRMVFSRARLERERKRNQAAWEELEQRIEALQKRLKG